MKTSLLRSTGKLASNGFRLLHRPQNAFSAVICAVLLISPPASGATRGAGICEAAALSAARQTGVPLNVLLAISLTETGRRSEGKFKPWPWTVNMEGRGVWFESSREALDFARRNHKRGARSFDVGCFQLNYKWHGKAFRSIEEMFDPERNALYAANYLRDLRNEKGNWIEAAGAYHSRTPKYANRYKRRFANLLATLPDAGSLQLVAAARPEAGAPVAPRKARVNNFPLLLGGPSGPASLGSLMPDSAGAGARRLIGGS